MLYKFWLCRNTKLAILDTGAIETYFDFASVNKHQLFVENSYIRRLVLSDRKFLREKRENKPLLTIAKHFKVQ